MTTTETVPDTRTSLPLTHATLPWWAPILVGALALAAGGLIAILFGWGLVATVVLAGLVYLVALPGWSFVVENRRAATDRAMTTLVWAAFVAAVVPLVWLVYLVVAKGVQAISVDFLTHDSHNPLAADVGIAHALVGTLLVTLITAIISVPIGVMTAIFLVEYGKKSRLARAITFLVDVMTGIPSIVAGLFALSLFVLILGPAIRFGFGGAVALSLLMIPIVVRSTEEMLRLVPDDLREASYALGVSKWRTVVEGGPAHRAGRDHHRGHLGCGPGDRRDRAPARGVRCDQHHEHQPVQWSDDDPAGLHLLLVHPAGRGAVQRTARHPATRHRPCLGGFVRPHPPGVAAQPGCTHHRQDLRRPDQVVLNKHSVGKKG